MAGPVLRVLTANLPARRAAAEVVVELACRKHADVLFVQELTDEAAARLQQAGLGDLLPHRVTQPVPHGARDSIYARYPLRGGPLAAPVSAAQCTARLDLPSGQSVQLACIHAAPPKPPWSPGATARWRSQLSALPAPGDSPCILAGDFNATLDHAQFRQAPAPWLRGRGQPGRPGAVVYLGTTTGPAPDPTHRNQPRPHRPALRGRSGPRRPTGSASSAHRALYAELRLPPHSQPS